MNRAAIAVFGAGPAGLMAAQTCAEAGLSVTLYEANRLAGRKFLLAGRGGLNLTHSESQEAFVGRYRPGADQLRAIIAAFNAGALRAWADDLGAETFVGASGRVFPKAMKASPLLRAWLARLSRLDVAFRFNTRLTGFSGQDICISENGRRGMIRPSAAILALGGASWPELGADGVWAPALETFGAKVTAFSPSNAGVLIDWPAAVRARAGAPLKHIAVHVGAERFAGEAILTETGLEGVAIYAANASLRGVFAAGAPAPFALDLHPNQTVAQLHARLEKRDAKRSLVSFLHTRLGLSQASAAILVAQNPPRAPDALATMIKQCPLTVTGFAPLARAISSAGGVQFESLNPDLSLQVAPHIFLAGEMLDWDAPTGGYLLQACMATGVAAGRGAAAFVKVRR
jgi:uncharacterized flavoprotein (TIGR03862 family)